MNVPRWIKDGGWIVILAAIIFLTYYTFYLVYSQTHGREIIYNPSPYRGIFLESIDIFTLTAYATDVELPEPEQTPPPSDSEENFDEPLADEPTDGETSEYDSDPPPSDNDEIFDEPVRSVYSFSEIPDDSVSILIDIRDTLNTGFHVLLLCIACYIVYRIFLLIWRISR